MLESPTASPKYELFSKETDSNLIQRTRNFMTAYKPPKGPEEAYPLIKAGSPQVLIMSRNCFYLTLRREPGACLGLGRAPTSPHKCLRSARDAARQGCQPKASTRRFLGSSGGDNLRAQHQKLGLRVQAICFVQEGNFRSQTQRTPWSHSANCRSFL
jgi:hypothetical protein